MKLSFITQNNEKIESKTNQYNEESSQELTNVENKQQEDFATEEATPVDENSNSFQTSTTELPQIDQRASQHRWLGRGRALPQRYQ